MKPKPAKKSTPPAPALPHHDAEHASETGFQAVEPGTPFVLAAGAKSLPAEQWTPVFFLQGYEVSNDGRVRKAAESKSGYRDVHSKMGDEGYLMVTVQVPVHALVANSWLPNPDHLEHIRHKDGIRTHNHFLNLEFTDEPEA